MATLIAEFTVVGTPVSQGSMRSFERAGRTFTKSANAGPLEKWRGDVRNAVRIVSYARRGPEDLGPLPTSKPVSLRLEFRLPRPKGHFLPVNSKRPEPVLREGMPSWWPGGKDVDKLARAVLDALTNVLYQDDAQVVSLGAVKRLTDPGEQPGVDVRVVAL